MGPFKSQNTGRNPLQPNSLAVIGDSFTANWRALSANGHDQTDQGFLSWALALSGNKLTVISDSSAAGSQVVAAGSGTQMSTTQINAAVQSGAGHLLMMGGINDVFYGRNIIWCNKNRVVKYN